AVGGSVGDIKAACGVHGDTIREDRGAGGGSAFTREDGAAVTGDGGNDSARYFADAAVAVVGDVEVACGVDSQSDRRTQGGGGGGSSIARESGPPVPGHHGQGTVR